MAKIIYFTSFFTPESIAGAFRAADHSRVWASLGNDVTVFTGWPNYPTGTLYNGYEVEKLGLETIDGVRVFRSASIIQPNTSFKKRIVCGVSCILNGIINLWSKSPVNDNYDVAVVSSGTVFTAWLGVWYAKRNKIPLVVEFRDLTYRQLVAAGNRETSLKVCAMKALELSFCKAADRVVVLTNGFKDDLVAEGVDSSIVSVVPNGADIVPCDHAWAEKLRFGYFGTMGLSQDVPTTLYYARQIQSKGLAREYILIGEGAARADVESAILKEPDGFLQLSHGMSMAELEPYYSAVDMTIVSLQKSDSFRGTIPSKIFQSFARGVPVIFIGPEGEASRIVRESGGGIVLCGSRDEDLAVLQSFASRSDLVLELSRMSKLATEYMERNYTRKRLAEQMLEVLLEVSNYSLRNE